mgnify:CR=1 FL=1
MREVKRDFPWFSITEYEKEAAYLRRRHKFIYWQTAGGKKNRSSHKQISTHRVEILQYLNYFLNLYFPFP